MAELAAKIRAKYPGAYDDKDDLELESAVLRKFPDATEYAKLADPKVVEQIEFSKAQAAQAPKLSEGPVGKPSLSTELSNKLGTTISDALSALSPSMAGKEREWQESARVGFGPQTPIGALVDVPAGVVKGAGQTAEGVLQLLNRLTPDPESRAKLAEQFREARPEAAAGGEQAGVLAEHGAEFLLPSKFLGTVEKAPGLLNLLTRSATTGAEVAGVSAAQQGSTENLGRDFALGAALPAAGKAAELAAAGGSKLLPFLARGARTVEQYPGEAAQAIQTVAGTGLLGPLGALAGAVRIPGAAMAVEKLAGLGARAAESTGVKAALDAIAQKGPGGALGDAVGAVLRRVKGTGQAAGETSLGGAATPKAAAGDAAVEKVAGEGGQAGEESFSKIVAPAAGETSAAEAGSLEELLRKSIEQAKANPRPVMAAPEAAAEVAPRIVPGGEDTQLAELLRQSIRKAGGVVDEPVAAEAGSLEELLTQGLANEAKTSKILPDGQRAMAGGRSGLARSPEPPKPSLEKDRDAAQALQELLAGGDAGAIKKRLSRTKARKSTSGKSD